MGTIRGFEEFCNNAVEAGLGRGEQEVISEFGIFSHTEAIGGLDPVLEGEELAFFDEFQGLGQVWGRSGGVWP